jgi:membrane fusion protein (multidrug efflux system)
MKIILCILLATGLIATHVGCGGKNANAKSNGGPPEMAVPVETARVTSERLENKFSAVGTLDANEAVDIKSEIDAVVEKINFTEGSAVKKGDPLIHFDDAKWRAQYQQAKAEVENAKIRAERSDKLLKSDSVSQQEYDDAHAAARTAEANFALLEARLKETHIVAPFDGLVSERLVSPGAYAKAGDSLVRLVDLKTIKVNFGVPERYLTQLKLGQKVSARVASLNNRNFVGEVYFIDPQVDVMTRTIKVKAKIDNADGALRSGLFANVELTLDVHENAAVIPEEAILAQMGATTVFAVSDQHVTIRPVKTGMRIPGKVEILDGLKAGEEIVTSGHQKLFPGVKVVAVRGKEKE